MTQIALPLEAFDSRETRESLQPLDSTLDPVRDPGADPAAGQPRAGPADPPIVRHDDPPFEFVRHPRARRYVVHVHSNGRVRVTIPRRGSRKEAEAFAREQRPWIQAQLAKLQTRRAAAPSLSAADAQALRRLAEGELPRRLYEIADRLGMRGSVARVTIRDQRWRWGSCSPGGRISLNWRLLRMPDEVRDYVIIHELMHLRRMDHSRKFWALVAEACPGYQDARRWLRRYQATLA